MIAASKYDVMTMTAEGKYLAVIQRKKTLLQLNPIPSLISPSGLSMSLSWCL